MSRRVCGAQACRLSIWPARPSSFYIGSNRSGSGFPLEMLLISRPTIECIVRTAETHAKMIVESRRLRIDPETLIKIPSLEAGRFNFYRFS